MPYSPYSTDLPVSDFFCLFVSPDEKVLKGKHLADMEEMRQKMVEALKDIKIDGSKHCLEQ